MSAQIDDLFPEDNDDARDDAMRVLRGRGLRAATRAAIEVCEDPKAPAPAKATCAGWIFRVNGMLDPKDDEDTKQPHEMSAAELERAVRRAKEQAEALQRDDVRAPTRAKKQSGGGIFD